MNLLTDSSPTFQEHHFFIDEDVVCRHCGYPYSGTVLICKRCRKAHGEMDANEEFEMMLNELEIYRMIRRGELP